MAEKKKDEQEEVVAETATAKVEILHESEAPTSQTVMEAILSADLPKPVGIRLARGAYATVAELQAAVQEAAAEVVAILSGAPPEPAEKGSTAFGLSSEEERQTESAPVEQTAEQIAEAQKAVLGKYLTSF